MSWLSKARLLEMRYKITAAQTHPHLAIPILAVLYICAVRMDGSAAEGDPGRKGKGKGKTDGDWRRRAKNALRACGNLAPAAVRMLGSLGDGADAREERIRTVYAVGQAAAPPHVPIATLRWKGRRRREQGGRREGGGRREENVEGVEGMCVPSVPSLSIRCGAAMDLLTRSLACLEKRHGCARRRGRPGMDECGFWLSMHTWCFEIVRGTQTSSRLLRLDRVPIAARRS
jgi:hypothetical protein